MRESPSLFPLGRCTSYTSSIPLSPTDMVAEHHPISLQYLIKAPPVGSVKISFEHIQSV